MPKKRPWDVGDLHYDVTSREWQEEVLNPEEADPVKILRRCGMLMAYRPFYRKPYFPRRSQYKNYPTPFQYFEKMLEREEQRQMSTTAGGKVLGLFTSTKDLLQDKLVQLKERNEELDKEIISALDAQEQIRTEITRTERAIVAYLGEAASKPTTETPAFKEAAEGAAEEVQKSLVKEPTPAQEEKEKESKQEKIPPLTRARANLSPTEQRERDDLKALILLMAQEGSRDGMISKPELAMVLGEEYRGQGAKKFALQDAFTELENEGILVRHSRQGRTVIFKYHPEAEVKETQPSSPLGGERVRLK